MENIFRYNRNETLEQQINRERLSIEKHKRKLQDLLDSCPHENVVKKERHFEGDYYNKAHTEYYKECTLCGKELDWNMIQHDWYG